MKHLKPFPAAQALPEPPTRPSIYNLPPVELDPSEKFMRAQLNFLYTVILKHKDRTFFSISIVRDLYSPRPTKLERIPQTRDDSPKPGSRRRPRLPPNPETTHSQSKILLRTGNFGEKIGKKSNFH